MSSPVNDSEFNMWRAVFAFAFVDHSLSLEEQELLQSYLNHVPFSKAQRDILHADFLEPPDVVNMYQKITEIRHRERFCALARALVWCEGDMDRQEEIILKRVSCLSSGEDAEILHRSRDHAHTYYQYYAKSGMTGLLKARPSFETRV
jgi:hypothetical protein